MDTSLEFTTIDFSSVFLSVFIILIAIKSISSILEWVSQKLGLETKWMRARREEHNLLLKTSQHLTALQEKQKQDMEKSDMRDEEISNDIKKLTFMFIEKEIDDIRWEINNFATKISEGKP